MTPAKTAEPEVELEDSQAEAETFDDLVRLVEVGELRVRIERKLLSNTKKSVSEVLARGLNSHRYLTETYKPPYPPLADFPKIS